MLILHSNLLKMVNLNIQNIDKRIIDLKVGELLELLDERYAANSKDNKILDNATVKSDFLNVKQCASLTGYNDDYIRQLVFKGKIPFYKIQDHSIRFSRKEIIDWMTTKKYVPVAKRAQQYIEENDMPSQLNKL